MQPEKYLHRIIAKFSKGKGILVLGGILSTMFMAFMYIFSPPLIRDIDARLYDIYLEQSIRPAGESQVVVVDLDEKSLSEIGQWPWPRYQVAVLLARIAEYGAKSVGLDVVLAERDRTSPAVMLKEYGKLGINLEFSGLPPALLDNDVALSKILEQGPFVLGYFMDFSRDARVREEDCFLHGVNNMAVKKEPGAKTPSQTLFNAPRVICNLNVLSEAASSSGFFNTVPDPDGVIRKTPLLMHYDGAVYPSLALATLIKSLDEPQVLLSLTSGGVESLTVGEYKVPLDHGGQFMVKYRGPARTFKYYSAADIIAKRVSPGELKDKIVFIGTSAAGLMDIRTTPLSSVYPGVEVHATIVDNILKGEFISRPDWAPGLEFILILLAGVLTTVMLMYLRASLSFIPVLTGACAVWFGFLYIMKNHWLYLSPQMPILTFAATFALLTSIKYWREEREKKFFHTAFSRYVSNAIVDQMVADPSKLSLEGEEREVSIFFSDIRGFTSISEILSPTQITNLLHEYFTPMTKIIINNLGTVDKFIGDAIMAFWNAPINIDDHQYMALKSSMEMIAELERLNVIFKEKFDMTLAIGIGIHCGNVRVGNMGSEDLFNYTIIGDSVNLASRLEGLTKYYGVQIVLSETIYRNCSDLFKFFELDKVRVKGKKLPITIYTIYKESDEYDLGEELKAYNEALDCYKKMEFIQARDKFEELYRKYQKRQLYSLYMERCEALSADPPGNDWDGVFTHKSK